jgi:death-on-curing protein
MKNGLEDCFHLTVDIVQEIHEVAIGRFGGMSGVRENSLLESAVAAPQATFRGKSPYEDLIEIGAAYLFYLCKNHPFIDGNKRVALGSALLFFRLNGIEPIIDGSEWEELTLDVASSKLDRQETTDRLQNLIQ